MPIHAGAPRIHGELLKLGIEVSQGTMAKYMVRHRKPPSQNWRTFLTNHAQDLVFHRLLRRTDADVPVALRFCGVSHNRRRLVHFGVTSHPTAEWTAQQLWKHFPGTALLAICCATAMETTVSRFAGQPSGWGFVRY